MSLSMRAFLDQLDELDLPDLLYPYRQTDRALNKLFLYGLVRSITRFKTLHTHLLERPDVFALVGSDVPPARTTLSRRYKTLSKPLQDLLEQLSQKVMHALMNGPTQGDLVARLLGVVPQDGADQLAAGAQQSSRAPKRSVSGK